jgi:hypothetical protein
MNRMASLTRDQAIRVLEDRHAANAELFDRLSDEQMIAAGTIANGDWSAKDLMGHIAAWERYGLETRAAFVRNEQPAIEAAFADEDGVDRLNDEAVARDADLPLQRVRDESEATFRELTATIRSMTDADWSSTYDPRAEEKETIGEVLGGLTGASPPDGPFAHAAAHVEALRTYVKSVSG